MTLRLRRSMPVLLAILVVLASGASSFAQVSITILPTPSPNEIGTNHSAQTWDPSATGSGILVSGSVLAPSSLTTTVFAITYPATITSSSVNCDTSVSSANTTGRAGTACGPVPPEDPIQIVGASGLFANVSNLKLNTNLKRIEIDLPGAPVTAPASTGGSFTITGVRLDVNGLTAPITATPSLGAAGNNYFLSTTSFNAINAVGSGIASLGVGARAGQTNQGTAAILTNRTVPKGTGSMLITGGFAGAFRTRAQLSTTNSLNGTTENSTQIRLTFSNIPTGVTVNLSVNGNFGTIGGVPLQTASFCVSSGCNGVTGAGLGGTTSVTAATNTAVLEMVNPSLSSTPTIEIDITSITLSSTAAVTTPGTISVTASMQPFCTASVDSSGLPTTANGYPCFTETETTSLTIVNILPVSTTMLMPYALTLPPFDTGLAVANTTADPFGTTGGGATPTAGTITLNFFPTTSTGGAGTPFSLTTSSTVKPGNGLSSDGTLAAGATWAVLMSQLLTAAGQTGTFQGYVFITANFLDAHGTATISDFRTYSLTANVLVMPPPATQSRATPLTGAEQLHY